MIRHVQILVLGVCLALEAPSRCNAEIFSRIPVARYRFRPLVGDGGKGIWKKHGLDVELIYLRGGSRTVSALIGGSVDFVRARTSVSRRRFSKARA